MARQGLPNLDLKHGRAWFGVAGSGRVGYGPAWIGMAR